MNDEKEIRLFCSLLEAHADRISEREWGSPGSDYVATGDMTITDVIYEVTGRLITLLNNEEG